MASSGVASAEHVPGISRMSPITLRTWHRRRRRSPRLSRSGARACHGKRV